MIQIRNGVFETNSSSTHSITMCMESDYDKWIAGELYWDRWNEKLVSKDTVDKFIKEAKNDFREENPEYIEGDKDWECRFEDYLYYDKDFAYYSYDEYCDRIEYETYVDTFTTPSGEKVVSFGYYGEDC